MSHEVLWSKFIVEQFEESAMLTDFERLVLRTRVAGWSISKQSLEFHCSESTINRTVATLKRKYDNAQKDNVLLPKRKKSVEEVFMDNN